MADRMGQWPTGRLVSAVARRIEREWNLHLSAWDLNHASLPVLAILARGPLSQRELAVASGVTEQTMSRIIARLERSDYVERRRPPLDRRRHAVVLTETGRRVLGEASAPRPVERMSSRGLTPEQTAQLRELLLLMLAAETGTAGPAGAGSAGPTEACTPEPAGAGSAGPTEACTPEPADGAPASLERPSSA